jgi:hypothetical protein
MILIMEINGDSFDFLRPEHYLTGGYGESELAGFNRSRQLILDYIDYHTDTFSFLVRESVLEIASDRKVVISRAEMMLLWLLDRSTSHDLFTLGRSLFAEIYFYHVLDKLFLNTDYNIIMLPTSLDFALGLKRGGDLLLCRIDYVSGIIVPVLFIDITTLKPRTSIKRKRKPIPINNILNVPVIVLPIGLIGIDSSFGGTFNTVEFMDKVLRVLILNGSYKAIEPLVGMPEEGKIEFKVEVLRLFSKAIRSCNSRLVELGLEKVSDNFIRIIEELSEELV